MPKELAQKLLRELIKNSKQSDRDLAKILKVSQATVSRTRQKLEKNGVIQDYTLTPDFRMMGFEIMALTFVKMRPDILKPEVFKETAKYAAKFPNAIFSSAGEGLGMNGVIISFHKNYTEYQEKLNLMRFDWKDFTEDIQNFLISIGEAESKRFSLTHLKDVPL